MADIRVRSTDGNNADDGSTWALAKADLHTAVTGGLAAAGAGGKCYVSQAHSQSTAATTTLTSPGTKNNPVLVICGNDAADPPTAVATTAVVQTSGAFALNVNGSAYFYGIAFKVGVGSGSSVALSLAAVSAAADMQVYENCSLENAGTGGSGNISCGTSASAESAVIVWRNCTADLSATAQHIIINTELEWIGGSLITGIASTVKLFRGSTGRPSKLTVRNVDFSNLNAACPLIDAAATLTAVIQDCKLPASFTGGLITGTPVALFRASMYNCDSGDTNYKLWIEDYAGTIRDETTIVMSGGATDGTTAIAWKMTTTANSNESVVPLISDWIAIWNDTTGSAKTLTVEIIHDSATALTDAEVWVDVEYLGTSGVPLGVATNDKRADLLTAAADQASSAATWTTTGLTNPNEQKLSVSITPQEKGFFRARVNLAKASYTIYMNPEIVVS